MEDIGIAPKQFEEACGKGSKRSFQHGLFEQVSSNQIRKECFHKIFLQVWAADDFEIFKRMMIQKNIELQLQALELLQQRYGVLPDSLQPTKKGDDSDSQVLDEIKRYKSKGMSAALMRGLTGQVNWSQIRNEDILLIQASSDYQALQTQPLAQGRGHVQPAPGHAPPPGGRAETVARGSGSNTQGTRGQGLQQCCFSGLI